MRIYVCALPSAGGGRGRVEGRGPDLPRGRLPARCLLFLPPPPYLSLSPPPPRRPPELLTSWEMDLSAGSRVSAVQDGHAVYRYFKIYPYLSPLRDLHAHTHTRTRVEREKGGGWGGGQHPPWGWKSCGPGRDENTCVTRRRCRIVVWDGGREGGGGLLQGRVISFTHPCGVIKSCPGRIGEKRGADNQTVAWAAREEKYLCATLRPRCAQTSRHVALTH